MDKLGRNYELSIQVDDVGTTLLIKLPFTVEFDITRNTLTSANVCQIRIYNLSLHNRNQIRYNVTDFGIFRAIRLRAGYGTNLPIIFTGNISQAWSVREGVNFITQIECYDGGFAFINARAPETPFPGGSQVRDVIGSLASSMKPYHVDLGAIGAYPKPPLSRGNSYNGNTIEVLKELSGGGVFIDNGKVNALGTDEVIATPGTLQINSSTGLLGTPVLERNIVRFDMIFEPSLIAGQKINLTSATGGNFDGPYKVTGLKHRGMISAAVCGSVITSGEFFFSKSLVEVPSFGN